MKNLSGKTAFTLAEIMIAVFISAIIAILFLKAIRTGTTHYTNNLLSYSALNSLSVAAYDMATLGCTTGAASDRTSPSPQTDPAHPYCDQDKGLLPRWKYTDPLPSPQTTPATIPNRGFCDRFAREEINVIGAIDCTQSATDSTGFTTATPNFVSTNGARYFNFGAAKTGQTATASTDFYTVYIDIDGKKRSGRLTESAAGKKDVDVIKFYVSMDGNTVVPDPDSIATNDTEYLTASVKYMNAAGTAYVYVLTGVNYRRAICATNPILSFVVGTTTINYCEPQTTYTNGYNPRPSTAPFDVTACATNTCIFELDEPGMLGVRNIFNVDNK
jgi:hypothetical protein